MRGKKNNNRWSMWARSIARRHVRFTERRESLSLIVLRMRGPLSVVRERWLFTTRIVRPQVHLAINAVLEQRRQGATADSGFLSTFATLREKTSATTSTLLRVLSQTQKEVRSERLVSRVKKKELRSERTTRDMRFERLTERSTKPLTLVFERINTSKTSTHSSRLEVLVHQHARSIVERVTQQSRRNETMHIGGSNTLITQHMSASSSTELTQPRVLKAVAAPTRVMEKTMREAAPVTTVVETAPWLQDKVSVKGMNIDQITDQVVKQLDRRVVAARERMGRV